MQCAVLDERMERSPAFVLRSLRHAVEFARWIRENRTELSAAAETTSRYARCIAVDPIVEGNHVYLYCGFQTGDAAGQNMVTIATAALCRYIVDRAPHDITSYVIESNFSGDKKATARVFVTTRGRRVSADVTLPAPLVVEYLHVEPRDLAAYWRLAAVGAAMSLWLSSAHAYLDAPIARAGMEPARTNASSLRLLLQIVLPTHGSGAVDADR